MKPQVSETYQREGVYATIKGAKTFEVRPDLDLNSDQYVLIGPRHKSIHRGYYEAVKEGIALASQA
jgi:ketol-acid reductoisomerase